MAGEIPDLHAEVRTGSGKGAARQTRRDGKVPGVVYGGGADPLPIQLPFNELLKRLKAGRFMSTLFNLKVDGQDDVRIICRDVQRDPVKDLPTHFDFLRLKRTTKIALFIPVEFINHGASPGLKRGGVLTVVRPEIELLVTAGEIPDHVTVDLTGLKIHDAVHVSQAQLPPGTKPTIERDFIIASISAPSGLVAAEEEEGIEVDEVARVGEED
jgi:large subunit ribosomal protein L25